MGLADDGPFLAIGAPASLCGKVLIIRIPDGDQITRDELMPVQTICTGRVNIMLSVWPGECGVALGVLMDQRGSQIMGTLCVE